MNNQLSKNLQVFRNELFNIRTIFINEEPWFVAKDICEALNINNTTSALNNLEDDERSKFNLGRQGEANIINESGLYSIIMSSRKPEAKVFKSWVTKDVLPTIRKTGGYSILDNQPQTYLEAIKALVVKEEERLALEHKINTSTLFPEKEKVYDKERGFKKDVRDIYPFIYNGTITNILEYYTKSKYKETNSYIKDELQCVQTFFEECQMSISKNKITVLITHPCLLTSKLRVSKENAIEYLDYTEEDFE